MKKLKSIKGIPLSYIQSILKIDPDSPSGLTWIPKEGTSRISKSWNFRHANNHAGCIRKDARTGYQKWVMTITCNRKNFNVICSRVVFLLHNGYLTKYKVIDHEDNNALNNNPDNLRESTRGQNAHNSKLRKDNTSGIKGLYWNEKTQKWVAELYVNSKKIFIGYFLESEKENAKKAIEKTRKKLHGKFGRNE